VIGFYVENGEFGVDEKSPVGSNLLAEVAQAWEEATAPAEAAGINTIHLRFGIVLAHAVVCLRNYCCPLRWA
jgi:NAD dependent epimerase/dehydratase family enzyme